MKISCYKITVITMIVCLVAILAILARNQFYQMKIEEVLRRDKEVYDFIKRDKDSLPYTVHKINNYIAGLKNIPLRGLPIDFINAWNSHLIAWELLSYSLEKNEKDLDISFIKSALIGDIPALLKNIIEASGPYVDQEIEKQVMTIHLSWNKVLKIAEYYGCAIK